MSLPAYVGRYEVRREIARGGFAVVVEAWDEELGSPVAIKILDQSLAHDTEIQRRFLEEARLLRRVRAPNVVTVHDVGRLNDGRPYFVLDFADRGTLAARLVPVPDPGAIDSQSIMVLVDALADGLTAVHEAGLVHRDVKPANIFFQLKRRSPRPHEHETAYEGGTALVASDERVLVGDLGIAKDLSSQSSFPTVVGGTPLYQAPEQSDASAEVTPAADIYACTAVLWTLLTGQQPPPPGALPSRLSQLPEAWRALVTRGMDPDPRGRFSDMDSWRAAAYTALAPAPSRKSATATGQQPRTTADRCPYKGLAAYQTQDAQLFCGREALVDELLQRIRLHRVLVIGGPSGSGKSSLVRAGLIPALEAGAITGSESWRIALFTPGHDPVTDLYFQIGRTEQESAAKVTLQDLLTRPTMARHLASADDPNRPLLLCIDQFEELFTLAPASQREAFFVALAAMTDPADSMVRAVVCVRADFYGACASVPWLAERITDNQVLVGPMTTPELRRAISEPARRAGLYLERGLLEAILDEAGSESGSLPLVAHALLETWLRREGNTLTLQAFKAVGGVAGAISQSAEAIYEHHSDPHEREAIRRLFLRLVTPGEGTPDTRRLLPREEIARDSSPEVMRRVVDRLTEARLLTVDDVNVQIAHEALLQTWPRLHGWIEECRDDLRTRQRISRAAAEWNAGGRDDDLLYRGTPLLSAQEWASRNADQLGPLERAFLDASAQNKARIEAVTAEKRRKAQRLRRGAVAALSLFAVGATAASVAAFLAFREAQRNEERAAIATAEARERFAGALGAAAYAHASEDPLLALFLAAESVARAEIEPPAYDARAAMLAARRSLAQPGPFLLGSPIVTTDAMAIALGPDARSMAVAGVGGTIDLTEPRTRIQRGPSLRGHRGGIRDLEFAPNGSWLVSVGADGTVRHWTLGAGLGARETLLGTIPDVVSGVDIDPTGALIASANGDGTVQLWDPLRGGALGEPFQVGPLGFKVVEFSPDRRAVVAGYNDGTLYGWKLPSREPLFEPIRGAHTSNLSSLVFSPGGEYFATASTDGSSVVFEYPTGRVLGPAFGSGMPVSVVTFSHDGNVLIGGTPNGELLLWDVVGEHLLGSRRAGHSQSIIDADLSLDGELLATLGRDQLVRLWTFESSDSPGAVLQVPGRAAKGVAFSADGGLLAAGDSDGSVRVWDLQGKELPLTLRGHQDQVWALAFAPDGLLLASADRGGELRLWNAATAALVWSAQAHDEAVWSLAFGAQGAQLISAGDTGLKLWDSTSGALVQELAHHAGRITRAVGSADGRLLATASTSGTVTLWDLPEGRILKQIAAADDLVWSVAFSQDGRRLATGSGDEVLALWDVTSGRRLAAFAGHSGGATDVAWLADGVTVVASDRSGKLHWWDTDSGRRLSDPWPAHTGASWRLAVHPDGERLATSGDDGAIRVWDDLSIARACEIGGPAMDATRRQQYLGEVERSLACSEAMPTLRTSPPAGS